VLTFLLLALVDVHLLPRLVRRRLLEGGDLADVEVAAKINSTLFSEREDAAEEQEDSTGEDDVLLLGPREATEELVRDAKEDGSFAAHSLHALSSHRVGQRGTVDAGDMESGPW
jgi:hypothetical protein